LVASGLDDDEIAKVLGTSRETVEMGISSVLAKLCLEDRAQAVAWAEEHIKSL
jgi:DNA-binding NarL/FixJ family response regulator